MPIAGLGEASDRRGGLQQDRWLAAAPNTSRRIETFEAPAFARWGGVATATIEDVIHRICARDQGDGLSLAASPVPRASESVAQCPRNESLLSRRADTQSAG
jgi:hypothetical protein